MSESLHILSGDAFTWQPMSQPALDELHQLGFQPAELTDIETRHRAIIRQSLGPLSVSVAVSHFTDPAAVPDFRELPHNLQQFSKNYAQLLGNPVAKQAVDSELVLKFLRTLGPTNPLKIEDGPDAGPDLMLLARLLRQDYDNLPNRPKRPTLRFAEAVTRAELALLWEPATTPAYREKWDTTGAELCSEAATLFRSIARSSRADYLMRLDALQYAIDMEVRQLTILAGGLPHDSPRRQKLHAKAVHLSKTGLDAAHQAWEEPREVTEHIHSRNGRFYDTIVVANRRRDSVMDVASAHLTRKALPREDRPYRWLPTIIRVNEDADTTGFHKTRAKIGFDVIEEDEKHQIVRRFQVKVQTKEEYEQRIARARKAQVHVLADMIFLDESLLPSPIPVALAEYPKKQKS